MTLQRHTPMEAKDARFEHLWPQILSLPYFRGLLRAVEARFYENIELPSPTLDLGCGDGHFASHAFDRVIDVGLDPWEKPLREAETRGVYGRVVLSEASSIPYPDGYFASAVSNSVLEHITDLEPVLKELGRVLRPGAWFIFCVPNHRFLDTLSIGRFFDGVCLRSAGNWYRGFFNRISRHHHCDDPVTWQERLTRAGFEVIDWWHYFSPRSLRVLEWGHYLGLPALISRKLFGRWIIAPWKWNLFFTHLLIQSSYSEASIQEDGVYTFYITKKTITGN